MAVVAAAAASTVQETRAGLRHVRDVVLEPTVRVEVDFCFCRLEMYTDGHERSVIITMGTIHQFFLWFSLFLIMIPFLCWSSQSSGYTVNTFYVVFLTSTTGGLLMTTANLGLLTCIASRSNLDTFRESHSEQRCKVECLTDSSGSGSVGGTVAHRISTAGQA